MANGKRIQRARLLAGLSSRTLAQLMGVHPVSVRRWECDMHTPNMAVLRELAGHLNTTASYLLGDEAYDEPFRRFTGEIPFRHTVEPDGSPRKNPRG